MESVSAYMHVQDCPPTIPFPASKTSKLTGSGVAARGADGRSACSVCGGKYVKNVLCYFFFLINFDTSLHLLVVGLL